MPAAIGEALRQARLAQGVGMGEIEARTKIRVRYLRALEAEDWDALPGDAYVRGFLGTYAEYLGLDGPELVEAYRRVALPAESEQLIEPLLERGRANRAGTGLTGRAVGGLAGLGVVALLLILGLTGGGDDGGSQRSADQRPAGAPLTDTTTTTSAPVPPEPSQVAVRLAPTGTVWVCLVDQSGRPLVDGETLTAGDDRGPFRSPELKLTLGNGEMELQVDGRVMNVPDSAEPIGYVLTPGAVRPLNASARPTCT